MDLILGLGKSGFATARFLKKNHKPFCVFDDNLPQRITTEKEGFPPFTPSLWPAITRVIISPGVPYSHPIPHPLIQEAKNRSISIVTDCTLFLEQVPQAKIIGVTGTNGKSTVTALIAHVLKELGISHAMGGNIGIEALNLPLDKDVYVLELSSFQLERSPSMHLHTAVWTNITEDHLEQHGTMENYIAAKTRIFENAHHKVIGVDDPYSTKVAQTYSDALTVTVNIPFFTFSHPTLKGEHNLQNIFLCIAALKTLGLDEETILKGILSFKGLAHRQEFIASYQGISFINDSKATNAEATQHALKAFSNIYWLLGGKDKSDGIDSLIPLFPKITKAYVFGAAKERFFQTLQQHSVAVESFETLQDAFQKAYDDALIKREKSPPTNEESTILLSPACASYDQFRNFEERGDAFRALVHAILQKG